MHDPEIRRLAPQAAAAIQASRPRPGYPRCCVRAAAGGVHATVARPASRSAGPPFVLYPEMPPSVASWSRRACRSGLRSIGAGSRPSASAAAARARSPWPRPGALRARPDLHGSARALSRAARRRRRGRARSGRSGVGLASGVGEGVGAGRRERRARAPPSRPAVGLGLVRRDGRLRRAGAGRRAGQGAARRRSEVKTKAIDRRSPGWSRRSRSGAVGIPPDGRRSDRDDRARPGDRGRDGLRGRTREPAPRPDRRRRVLAAATGAVAGIRLRGAGAATPARRRSASAARAAPASAAGAAGRATADRPLRPARSPARRADPPRDRVTAARSPPGRSEGSRDEPAISQTSRRCPAEIEGRGLVAVQRPPAGASRPLRRPRGADAADARRRDRAARMRTGVTGGTAIPEAAGGEAGGVGHGTSALGAVVGALDVGGSLVPFAACRAG